MNCAANEQVLLRVATLPSCCTEENCLACDQLADEASRSHCYARGCCCFGQTCDSVGCCSDEAREAIRNILSSTPVPL